jgi:hypothetical protein
VAKRKVFLLFTGELNTGYRDALLPAEEKDRLGGFEEVCLL